LSEELCAPRTHSTGFTLIEVIAALVIFAGGVLMVIRMSGSLSGQMEWAGTASDIVVVAQARLDSLDTMPFDSLSTGITSEVVTVRGKPYTLATTITTVTALLLQIDVSMSPGAGLSGPSYSTTTYAADSW